MNFLRLIMLLMTCSFSTLASGEDPPLVRAVVRELTHDPNSAPIENRNIPGKQPPAWTVRLEVLEVFRGDKKLVGQTMITSTADSLPQGNGRFVTPRLNEGDVGIWAIKRFADGSWGEVYSPYKVEKGIRLPLIKGRHDAYEKVLRRLTGVAEAPSSSIRMTEAQDQPVKTVPPAVPVKKSTPQPSASLKPVTEETQSSSGFPIVPVAIIVASIVGILIFLLRRSKR